jgi:microcin C transport system permease protein
MALVSTTSRSSLREQLREKLTINLSPINQRRWNNFRANRRGYWALWIFLSLFTVTLFAELIANDKPLLLRYKGEFLVPVMVDYPEQKFGGFLAVTDYKDPVILEELSKNGWMIWPPVRYSYSSINKDFPRVQGTVEGQCLGFPAPPPWASRAKLCEAPPDQIARFTAIGNRNWLGTDDQGRDVLARMIYGFRISVLFALILTILSSILGILAGAVQGYFGGKVDLVFQRFLEIWSSIPELYVLIIISSVLIPGFWTLLFVLLCFSWVGLVGVVPNATVATLTFLPFKLSGSVTALTALDFLGLGLPPGSPSLGELLAQGKSNLQAPWLGIAAFASIAALLSLLIFIGEAVRDALDPRKTFK